MRIASTVDGNEDSTQVVRRNLIRYACLSQVLVLRDVSVPVRKRFPTIESIVDAGKLYIFLVNNIVCPKEQVHALHVFYILGFMNDSELQLYEKVDNGMPKYWLPIHWSYLLVKDLRVKGIINCDMFCNAIFEELKSFRFNLQRLINFDWVSSKINISITYFTFQVPVPLAYPQVVFLAVRCYFFICLFSRQYTTQPSFDQDWYVVLQNVVPFMTALQFFFCMGWLKVAEALLNPLGDDDDDFETNFILDRNLAVSN